MEIVEIIRNKLHEALEALDMIRTEDSSPTLEEIRDEIPSRMMTAILMLKIDTSLTLRKFTRQYSKADLLKRKGLGSKSIRDFEIIINSYGLTWK